MWIRAVLLSAAGLCAGTMVAAGFLHSSLQSVLSQPTLREHIPQSTSSFMRRRLQRVPYCAMRGGHWDFRLSLVR